MDSTEPLRELAPNWSLAGDKQLLDVLQNIHQRIISKCEESNVQLEALVAGLDDADIQLRNVNNKFTALSNKQFVESRVYDDDVDLHPTTDNSNKESETAAESESELSRLRRALRALEGAHEEVRILRDSDTDSDSDSDSDQHADRLVLRVRDVYARRPLPHRIGSRAFADNWHAGLLVEDSDSESSVSKRDEEQFSETEEEDVVEEVAAGGRDTPGDEREELPPPPGRAAPPRPAQVAAELARRLAPTVDIDMPIPVPEYEPPARAQQRVYRPHLPPTSTVFPDEPPPLDESSDESDGDIFAQLHKNKPYDHSNRDQDSRDPVDDLFQGLKDNADEEFRIQPPPVVAKQKPPLFEQEEEPQLFVHETDEPNISNKEANNGKKPVGGISLFGNTSGAESIGAAILRRNQKKSTSVEETDDEVPIRKDTKPAEKNILDDIFAKPEKPQKNILKKQNKEVERKKDELPKKNTIDLFSDDLFDDIDDIFTNNVVTKPPDSKPAVKTSIFDDDLFSVVDVKETDKKPKPKLDKGLFDSDDDLFNEKVDNITEKYLPNTVTKADNASASKLINTLSPGASREIVQSNTVTLEKNANLDIKAKSIFDSDEELFSGNTKDTLKNETVKNQIEDEFEVENKEIYDSNEVVNKSVDKKLSDNLSKLGSTRSIEKDFDENIARSTSILEEKTFTKTLQFENENEILNKNKTLVVPEVDKSIHKKAQISTNYNISEKQHVSEATDSKKIEDYFDKTITTDGKVESHTFNKSNIDKFPKKSGSLFDDNDISKKVQKQLEPVQTHQEKIYSKPQETTNNVIISSNENRSTKSMEPNVSQSISSPALFTDEDDNSMETETFIRQSKTESNVLRTTKIISDHEKIDNETNKIENNPNNVLNNTEIKTEINSPSLFNDDEFEDNLFKKTIDKERQVKDVQKSNTKFKTNTDNNYDLDANKNIKTNDNLFTRTENFDSNDIFSDVFTDQPPDFEKPKEHKRSQNVNALFDDDSDDESLFFRKTDPTLDELPKDLADNTNQNMFGLFHDEPPAIDVDFTTKTDSITKTIQRLDSDETSPVKAVNMDSLDEYNQNKNSKKPVGKLKPLNLNINVNTLLPGASPKKQKPVEQVDGQISSSNLIPDLQNLDEKIDNAGSNKVASFDNKVESGVLNNKISKERAKIQIKRRPSTRRARKEAARKSGIDFGEDSTDRSSPIDVSLKKSELIKSEEPLSTTTYNSNENLPISHTITNETDSVQDLHNSKLTNSYTKPLFEASEKTINTERECEDYVEHEKHIDIVAQEKVGQKSVTSKTVYILNDEDIFTDAKVVGSIPEQEVGSSSITEKNTGITTLGNVYKEKSFMADSEDGDDLFKKSNDPKATVTLNEPKKSLFDDLSDDESELFGGKKRKEAKSVIVDSVDNVFGKSNMDKKKSIIKETKVTRSLFGDDDDDDDLFAAKPKKSEATPSKLIERDNTIKQNETEAVFVDPLSQLINEE